MGPSKRGPPKETLERLLLDNDLARWHANVSRGSLITADVYARRLRGFREQMQIPPKALARLPEKKLRDVRLDFITEEERKNRTGSYIDSTRKSVKSWLLHNGVRLTLPIRIKGVKDTPTLEEERGSGHAARRVGNVLTIKNFTPGVWAHRRPPQARERESSRGTQGRGRALGEATSGRGGGQGVLNLTADGRGE